MQTTSRRFSPPPLAFMLVGVFVVALAVRAWHIDDYSLWGDELYSISFSRVPLDMLWGDWMVRETNPPLFYSLLKGWIAVFGEQDVAIRVLPLIAGLLALGAIYLFGRALHSPAAGLVAVALAAVASLEVSYSLEIRGYIFGALFASLTLLALVKLVDVWKSDDVRYIRQLPWLALYVLGSTAAFHTHTTFFTLPVLANLAMAIIYFWRTPRALPVAIGWIAANAALLLLCLWWGLMTLERIRNGASPIDWIPEPTLQDTVAIMSHILATRSFEIANVLFGVIFGAIGLWGIWQLPVERRIILGTIGVGAPLILLVASLMQPVFLERTVFWLQFIYFACIAVGLLSLPWRKWRVPAVVAASLVLLADTLTWELTSYREPWSDVAKVIRENGTSRDAVLFYSVDASVNLEHYCRLQGGCGEAQWFALEERTFNEVLPEWFHGERIPRAEVPAYAAKFDRVFILSRRREDASHALGPGEVLDPNLVGDDRKDPLAVTVWRSPQQAHPQIAAPKTDNVHH